MLAISLLVGAAALVSASFHEGRAGHEHKRGVALCGGRGYDLGQDAYFYETNSTLLTPAACGAQCVAEWQCNTFAVGNGACLLYTATIDQNTQPVGSSPYVFWDKSCVAAQSLSTQPTATATSTQPGTHSTASAATASGSSTAMRSLSSVSATNTALAASSSSATATSANSGSSSGSSTSTASASSSTKTSAASPLQFNTNLGIAFGAAYGAIHFINMCL